MSFRDAFRRRTPGFAGGTLEDQLLRDQLYGGQEGVQVLTPQNQQAITRPRRAMPVPEEASAPIAQPSFKTRFAQPQQEGFGSSDEPFGSTRERRTQPRDVLADDSQYVRDLRNQPRGKRDIAMGVIDAVNAGFGNKPRTTLTKRERELQRAEGNLGMDVEMQKQALTQMTPVTLEDGTVVNVPARGAGTLQSQQQRIRQQNAESERRKEMDKNRVAHWGNMDTNSRKRLIAGLYGSGALNSPDLLEYAADELGVPGTLREKFISGQMRDAIDENGNLIQVNRQTQEVVPVTRDGQPVGAFAGTQEAGRNRRAAAAQVGATARAGTRGSGRGGATPAQTKAANALVAKYNYLRKAEMSTDIPAEQKAEIQRRRETVWQQVMDTYPGMFEADEKTFELRPKAGGSAPAQSGRTIDGAVQAFTKRIGRAPTVDEIARMKAALGQ